jgi:hypothetical protein
VRCAIENLDRADALLFGRVAYEMMEAAFRPPAGTGARPDWMEPFARTIDAAKKYVVSSTLDRVDWNAELVRGDLKHRSRGCRKFVALLFFTASRLSAAARGELAAAVTGPLLVAAAGDLSLASRG